MSIIAIFLISKMRWGSSSSVFPAQSQNCYAHFSITEARRCILGRNARVAFLSKESWEVRENTHLPSPCKIKVSVIFPSTLYKKPMLKVPFNRRTHECDRSFQQQDA